MLLSFVILVCRYNLAHFYFFQVYLWLTFLSVPLCCCGVAGCIREGQFDSVVRRDFITARIFFGLYEHFMTLSGIWKLYLRLVV